jgi:hypothetical protein
MNDTAKLEISVMAVALALGIMGDALLRSFPWGSNLALWLGALAATGWGCRWHCSHWA